MLRLVLATLLLMIIPLAATAQAPIERRAPYQPSPATESRDSPAPPPPIQHSVSLWPAPVDIPSGTRLLIETFNGTYHDVCIFMSLDSYQLICAGLHHRPSAIYPRELIASIGVVSRHYVPDHIAATAADTGLLLASTGLLCGVDGGPTCKTPAILGLSLIATGGILAIIQHHPRSHPPRILYLAAYPLP
jgi:hypothetical protein